MTDIDELRRWAAEVCGYTRSQVNENWAPTYIKLGKERLVAAWLPDQNIAQALEVLDAVRTDDYEIGSCGHDKRMHYCCIYGEPRVVCEHESRAMAILMAAMASKR